MVGFLHWSKSIALGTRNGIAKVALFLVILLLVLLPIALVQGDGLPEKMVLTADLRQSLPDSDRPGPFDVGRKATIMGFVLTLDHAAHDSRIQGLYVRVGDGGVTVPSAEELAAAIRRFRESGKFVIAHSQGFDSGGTGDY